MRISTTALRGQFDRAVVDWPWIRDVEDAAGLPPYLLFALGSRETNLRDVTGDSGHGRGIWQRDDRSFTIPDPYPAHQQGIDAAALLMSHFRSFVSLYPAAPSWNAAICAYNAGRTGVRRKLDLGLSAESATTHGDYGPDVIQRWAYIVYWAWSDL
jgi:hypothetical protein